MSEKMKEQDANKPFERQPGQTEQKPVRPAFLVIAGDDEIGVCPSLVQLKKVVLSITPNDATVVVKGLPNNDESAQYIELAKGTPEEVANVITSRMLTSDDYSNDIRNLIGKYLNNSECVIMEFSAFFKEQGITGASVVSQADPPDQVAVRQFQQGMVSHAELFKENMKKRGYTFDDSIIIPATKTQR